jgi:hypothetical protein
MTTAVARCRQCRSELELDLVVVIDLDATNARLDRMERLIKTEGKQITMTINDEIDAALAPVVAAVDAVSTDVARELADFAAVVAPKLSDDEKARFASIAQKLTDLDTSVNAADPAPAE